MERNDIHRIARKLMDEHGLTEWKLGFMNSKRAAGMCYYGIRTIKMSLPLAQVRDEDYTRMTILHEIAHALVGPRHRHDYVWQAKCLQIGGNGKAQYTDLDESAREQISRYVGTCPGGHKVFRHAKSEKMHRVSCGKCSYSYNPAFHYTWVDTQTGQTLRSPYAPVPRPATLIWDQVAANTGARQPATPARRIPPPRTATPTKPLGTSNPDDLWGTGD